MKGYYTDKNNNVLGYWDLPTQPSNTSTTLFVVSDTKPPLYVSQAQTNALNVAMARKLLSTSDATMLRIQEAISLGLTTSTTADVVAWVNYRKALRAIITTGSGTIPSTPNYPVNT